MRTSSLHTSVLALILAAAYLLPAQASTEVRRTFEYDLLFPKSLEGIQPTTTIVAPEIAPALERPINPRTYRIVPGDLLQLEVGGETDRAWRLAVNAEGKLILPGAKSLEVHDLTLEELVELTRTHLANHFPQQAVALHLLQPGSFRVTVTGQVNEPGVRVIRAYDRAAFVVGMVGGPRPDGSLRGIQLVDSEGSVREIDLVRFAILGEMDQNPEINPGTSIHVPPADDFVMVLGAVRGLTASDRGRIPNVGSQIIEPPRILLEWRDGDTIGFMLRRAGGISEEADGSLILVRSGERTTLDIDDSQDLLVEPDDIIEVSMRERYVYVIGAVRYPGPYAHLPSLTAADYVQLAGGPTEIGRIGGWRVRLPGGKETGDVGPETYLTPGTTVRVPERWTYRVSTLLAPISGITAMVISIVALQK